MSAGAARSYRENGAKTHWRRWIWNRIAERLTIPPREAVVVGLFGGESLDVDVAISKGFNPDRMFNVEVDSGAAEASRIRTIRGELSDVLIAWKSPPTIDVVVADYCGGMTSKAGFGLVYAATKSGNLSRFPVLAVNLLRGREQPGDPLADIRAALRAGSIHRGVQFAGAYAAELLAAIANDPTEFASLSPAMVQACTEAAAFTSYRSDSGNQVFDSVVMAPTHGIYIPPGNLVGDRSRALRARIAAIKAHAFGQRRPGRGRKR